jgi:integrase/recombinase XerD
MAVMYLVLNKKSPYYQIVYYRNGRRTSISTGTSNRKKAEKYLGSFNPKEIRAPKRKKKSVRLSRFITEYKDYVGNTYSENYLNKAVVISFNRLQYYVKDVQIDSISAKQIDQFISSVYSKSKYAALLYYKTLKAAFNKAIIWNYLKENPFSKIRPPRVPRSFPKYISETELIMILNNTTKPLLKDIFTTAFYTGMRLSEILHMKWDWIDFKTEYITVKNSESFSTKSKRERVIPTHPKVNKILKKRAAVRGHLKDNYVFYRYEGIKLNEEFISKQFKRVVRSSGVNENIHFHSLRHSFASTLIKHGVSLYVVKELLGHSNIITTQIYSHLDNGSLSQAIKKLAG